MSKRLRELSRREDGGQTSVHRQLDGRAVRHQMLRLAAGAGTVAPREHLAVGVDDAAFRAPANAHPRLDPDSLHLSVTAGIRDGNACHMFFFLLELCWHTPYVVSTKLNEETRGMQGINVRNTP
jgi:hypothetical protein